MNPTEIQKAICKKYNVKFCPSDLDLKLGISKNVKSGVMPINGLRHMPEDGTSGWFIWAGEHLPADPDFFVPLHVKHVDSWSKLVSPYLGLSPGWRFLVADNCVDVWFDEALLPK